MNNGDLHSAFRVHRPQADNRGVVPDDYEPNWDGCSDAPNQPDDTVPEPATPLVLSENALYDLVPISALGPAEEPDWVWPGYVARGSITLFMGLWKAGKTTVLKHLIRDIQQGGGLVQIPSDDPIMLISEEPPGFWAERRDALKLNDKLIYNRRKSFSRTTKTQWCQFIELVAADVERLGIGTVIIDTLSNIWPVENENDASEVTDALTHLRTITAAGAAVILVHHPRKDGGGQGTSSRGSGALTGFVEVILELSRSNPDDRNDTKRILTAYSRYETTTPETVIELTPTGFTVLGDRFDVQKDENDSIIEDVLKKAGKELTGQQIRDLWTQSPRIGINRLNSALNEGARLGKWNRHGLGMKGQPFTYSME